MDKQSKLYSYPSSSNGPKESLSNSINVTIEYNDWTYENKQWYYEIRSSIFHQYGYEYYIDSIDSPSTAVLLDPNFSTYLADGKLILSINDPNQEWEPPATFIGLITAIKPINYPETELSNLAPIGFAWSAKNLIDEKGTVYHSNDVALKPIISTAANSTPENIAWNNGSGNIVGTLGADELPDRCVYLVPSSTTGTEAEGEYQRALNGNYIAYTNVLGENDTYVWVRIGATTLDTLHTHTVTKTTASITGVGSTTTTSHVTAAGTNGSASSLVLNVNNDGVLSFSYTPNTPTTLPTFEDVTVATAAGSATSVLTDVSVNNAEV